MNNEEQPKVFLDTEEMHICGICGKPFQGFGNNPAPFYGDVCCDKCNAELILPIRLFLTGMIGGGVIFGEDMTIRSITPEDQETCKFSLKELQSAVKGYIEFCYAGQTKNYSQLEFIANEEGLMHDMVPNVLAYQLFGLDIVGPLLVVNKKNLAGEDEVIE